MNKRKRDKTIHIFVTLTPLNTTCVRRGKKMSIYVIKQTSIWAQNCEVCMRSPVQIKGNYQVFSTPLYREIVRTKPQYDNGSNKIQNNVAFKQPEINITNSPLHFLEVPQPRIWLFQNWNPLSDLVK